MLLLIVMLVSLSPWHPARADTAAVLVKDINTTNRTSSSAPYYLTAVGNEVYFTADDGTKGQELWKSDGTAARTALVKDIRPDPIGGVSAVGDAIGKSNARPG